MADVVTLNFTTGSSLYAQYRQTSISGTQVWNGTAMEALLAANWLTYNVAFAETAGTGLYTAAVPALLLAGQYTITVFQRANLMDAATDSVIATHNVIWDGDALSEVSTVFGEGGAAEWTYTVFQANGVTPIPDAAVYLSSDASGLNRSNTRVSDDAGQVTFRLDPGTVYVWRLHPLFAFTNPDTEVVA